MAWGGVRGWGVSQNRGGALFAAGIDVGDLGGVGEGVVGGVGYGVVGGRRP